MARTTATAKILHRLAKGMDDAPRIAREAGCSRAYVDRVAQREGYTLKSRLLDAAATRKAIAKLVAKKKKPMQIQEALGLTKRLVGYHLAILGAVTPQAQKSAATKKRRADVRKRRLAGESVTSLAKEYRVSPQAITNDLRGLKTHRSPERVAERHARIVAYHAQGRAGLWIADKMGMHPNAIYKVLRIARARKTGR